MAQRGRKSAASLSLGVVTGLPGQRPQPPDELTDEQAALWRSVVATKPADWFQPDTHPLLAQYVRHVTAARVLAAQIDGMDPACLADQEHLQRYEKLLAMRERESRAINALARGMRLTQQSRYDAAKADRASKAADGPSKPWEFAVGE